jgi:hypothetical protein
VKRVLNVIKMHGTTIKIKKENTDMNFMSSFCDSNSLAAPCEHQQWYMEWNNLTTYTWNGVITAQNERNEKDVLNTTNHKPAVRVIIFHPQQYGILCIRTSCIFLMYNQCKDGWHEKNITIFSSFGGCYTRWDTLQFMHQVLYTDAGFTGYDVHNLYNIQIQAMKCL